MLALFDVCTLVLQILGVLMDLTQNYVPNMASTLPLDTLCIAAWSHLVA